MNKSIFLPNKGIVTLTREEAININGGGFIVPFLFIGGIAAAGLAIYEAGKATGEFIYHITH